MTIGGTSKVFFTAFLLRGILEQNRTQRKNHARENSQFLKDEAQDDVASFGIGLTNAPTTLIIEYFDRMGSLTWHRIVLICPGFTVKGSRFGSECFQNFRCS